MCYINSPCLSLHEVTTRLTFVLNNVYSEPVLMAVLSKVWACSRLLVGIVVSDPAEGMDVCCECVLSDRGLCVGLITHPEESY